jgi:hypothetical protein
VREPKYIRSDSPRMTSVSDFSSTSSGSMNLDSDIYECYDNVTVC